MSLHSHLNCNSAVDTEKIYSEFCTILPLIKGAFADCIKLWSKVLISGENKKKDDYDNYNNCLGHKVYLIVVFYYIIWLCFQVLILIVLYVTFKKMWYFIILWMFYCIINGFLLIWHIRNVFSKDCFTPYRMYQACFHSSFVSALSL